MKDEEFRSPKPKPWHRVYNDPLTGAFVFGTLGLYGASGTAYVGYVTLAGLVFGAIFGAWHMWGETRR